MDRLLLVQNRHLPVHLQILTTMTLWLEPVGNPPKEDKLIHVGSTGVTKKEHNRQNKGTELYPLGQGQSKKSPRESTGAGSTSTGIKTYAGGKPTYASIVSNT